MNVKWLWIVPVFVILIFFGEKLIGIANLIASFFIAGFVQCRPATDWIEEPTQMDTSSSCSQIGDCKAVSWTCSAPEDYKCEVTFAPAATTYHTLSDGETTPTYRLSHMEYRWFVWRHLACLRECSDGTFKYADEPCPEPPECVTAEDCGIIPPCSDECWYECVNGECVLKHSPINGNGQKTIFDMIVDAFYNFIAWIRELLRL